MNFTVSASLLSIVLKKTARPSPKARWCFSNAPNEFSLPNNEADITRGMAERGDSPDVRKHSWLCRSLKILRWADAWLRCLPK